MRCALLMCGAVACAAAGAAGQDGGAAAAPEKQAEGMEASSAAEAPADSASAAAGVADTSEWAVLPVPTYAGDWRSRPWLLGAWGGARQSLAEKGVQFDVQWNQTLQSVVDGGRSTGTRYGGSADYVMLLDLGRMGLVPKGMVKFRGESRYGEAVNDIAGPLLPVNADGFFPLASRVDEDIPFTITNLAYYQYFTDRFVVFAGKIDTLDGDPNEFASGRGNTQFLNTNFLFNPVILGLAPYSTLAAGMSWTISEHVSVTSSVCNTADSSTTSGFEDIGDGWTWSTEFGFKYSLGELPGGQTLGLVYAWDNDFVTLDDSFVFRPGEGISVTTQDDAWAVYWNGWQYVWTEEAAQRPIDLTNGEPDLQGFGLFARAGWVDDDVSPLSWSASGGVGGKGIIPGRDGDTFGVGYYYTKVQTLRLANALGADDHAQGFEAFYNIAITPAAHLTLDAQVVEAAAEDVDTGVIFGMRLNLRF